MEERECWQCTGVHATSDAQARGASGHRPRVRGEGARTLPERRPPANPSKLMSCPARYRPGTCSSAGRSHSSCNVGVAGGTGSDECG